MPEFPTTPFEVFASSWRHRDLIVASTKREVLSRYRGSILGLVWSILNPVFMLAIYTLVFSVIFTSRWGGGGETKTEFALILFAGLIIFNLFSECIIKAPLLLLSNVNYVKKVVFPLEILPVVSLLSALFHTLISIFVWLIAYLIFFGPPHLTVLFLPLILTPFCLLLIGFSWTLAALGVFLRDLAQIIGMLITAVMFLSPIFYPASAFPENYRYILYINPLTTVVEQVRDLLFWGKNPDFFILIIFWGISLAVAWMGFVCFQKTRKGFADVL